MRFWFRVYSPHLSRWASYTNAERGKLLHDHASTVFEDHCRARFPGAQRFWERGVELDLVAHDPEDPKRLVVAEVKWRKLAAREKKEVLRQLQSKWSHCSLHNRYPLVRFEVLDTGFLANV